MFDIGFWEIILIAVVALFVVGPDEFPTLVRNAGRSLGKMRRFVSSVKSDLDFELDKADKIKELVRKEAEIAELHKILDERSPAVPVQGKPAPSNKVVEQDESNETGTGTSAGVEPERDPGAPQQVGDRRPDQRPE